MDLAANDDTAVAVAHSRLIAAHDRAARTPTLARCPWVMSGTSLRRCHGEPGHDPPHWRRDTDVTLSNWRKNTPMVGRPIDWRSVLLSMQDASCSVCNGALPGIPIVDHDHLTGLARGLVCSSCNSILGYADSGEPIDGRRAAAIARYLNDSPARKWLETNTPDLLGKLEEGVRGERSALVPLEVIGPNPTAGEVAVWVARNPETGERGYVTATEESIAESLRWNLRELIHPLKAYSAAQLDPEGPGVPYLLLWRSRLPMIHWGPLAAAEVLACCLPNESLRQIKDHARRLEVPGWPRKHDRYYAQGKVPPWAEKRDDLQPGI